MKLRTYDHHLGQMLVVVQRLLVPGHGAALIALSLMPTTGGDGFPATTTGESDIRHAGAGDPTGEVASRVTDIEKFPNSKSDTGPDDEPTGRPFDVDLVANQLAELFATMAEARGLLLHIAVLDASIVRRGLPASRKASGGNCICCERIVSGAVGDRLRGGLCEADSTAWYRYRREATPGFADSAVFLVQRRRHLGIATAA